MVVGGFAEGRSEDECKAWLCQQIHQACGSSCLPIEVYSKGKFRTMLWARFASICIRNRVVLALTKLRLSCSRSSIWMSGDVPLPVRVEKKFLFGLKRLLQSWGWQAFEIRIDDVAKSLSIDSHTVIRVSSEGINFTANFEGQWLDRLKDDALTKLFKDCEIAIPKQKMCKGTGKS